jgi:hypothetical protein
VTERELLHAIQLALGCRLDCRIWRVNVVRAKDPFGRMVTSGPSGSADLSGIHIPSGRRIELEVKSPKGTVRPEQVAFIEMVKSSGGIAGVVRSVDDAVALVLEASACR